MPELVAPAVASFGGGEQPVLQREGLLLRPFEPADAPAVVAAYADPDVQRWHVQRLDPDEAQAHVQRWADLWATSSRVGWAVIRDGHLVGRVTLTHVDLQDGQAEVTYWTVAAARGTGVAPSAVEAVVAWCFERVGFHRLELSHSTRNASSCRVADKTGFALEGTRRSAGLHLDGWHDMHLHARLA